MATGAFSFETESCAACKKELGAEYYRTGSWKICSGCADRTRANDAANSAGAYSRALIYGLGAAVLGCALYAAFTILTHIELALMAIAVAWLVTTAMRKGAHGCGGRRYQLTAAFLIYGAVSVSAVPIAIAFQHSSGAQTQAQSDGQSAPAQRQFDAAGAAAAVVILAGLGLASPFLELAQSPVNGAIGLVIVFAGIRYAWRMLRGSDPNVVGPFANTTDS